MSTPATNSSPQAISIADQQSLEKYETTLLFLLGFVGLSVLLAYFYKAIRKHVYNDAGSLDSTFDAGGNVSTSLTAVTVASQFMWPVDLLASSALATKVGIAGPFWYTAGCVFNFIIFPLVSVSFKARSPGAKTYLQVVYARFGKAAHIVYCVLAIFTNLVVVAILLVAGQTAIQSFTKDASNEFCLLMMAALFGSYCFVGGLGCTFYVAYFNAAIILSTVITLVLRVFYVGSDLSLEQMYETVKDIEGPEGNDQRSMLTFRSTGAIIWGVVSVFVSAPITYCDQANWQSRIAAKPLQGVLGFILATLIWYALPATLGTTCGLSYLSLVANSTIAPLTPEDIDAGRVTPLIAQYLLGTNGSILVLTAISMALMSTGSGEVMGISSIIVYDVIQTYVTPFRKNFDHRCCVFCGKPKHVSSIGTTLCSCSNPQQCVECLKDHEINVSRGRTSNPRFTCELHGDYRVYQQRLLGYRNWCILWVTIAIIPYGMALFQTGMDLNWVYFVGSIFVVPLAPTVVMVLVWSKTTGPGIIAGVILGFTCGIAGLMGMASTYEGGLGNFIANTSQDNSVLVGGSTCVVVSLVVSIVVSLCTTKIKSPSHAEEEWDKLFSIDNPLRPWIDVYRKEFPKLGPNERPTSEQMFKVFKPAQYTATIGTTASLVVFILIIPGSMALLNILNYTEFRVWVTAGHIWCFLMAFIVFMFAPIEEIVKTCKQWKKKKSSGEEKYIKHNSYPQPHGVDARDIDLDEDMRLAKGNQTRIPAYNNYSPIGSTPPVQPMGAYHDYTPIGSTPSVQPMDVYMNEDWAKRTHEPKFRSRIDIGAKY